MQQGNVLYDSNVLYDWALLGMAELMARASKLHS